MRQVKLWLDDERKPDEPGWIVIQNWDVARSYLLDPECEVTHLAIDNDLGSTDPETEGRRLVLWMAAHDRWPINRPIVLSSNIPAVEYMEGMISRFFDSCRCPSPIGKYMGKCMACEQTIRRHSS